MIQVFINDLRANRAVPHSDTFLDELSHIVKARIQKKLCTNSFHHSPLKKSIPIVVVRKIKEHRLHEGKHEIISSPEGPT